MKPLIAAAIGAAVGFALGIVAAVFGGTWLLSYVGVGPFADESYIAKRIRESEQKLGYTCAEVHATTYRFINIEMGRLTEATREGKAWLPKGREEFLGRVAAVRDRTMKCEMLQTEARIGNLPLTGNFKGYNLFLMSLDAYVSASDKAAPNDPVVKKELLKRLEREYRDLTAASASAHEKSPPTRGAGR